MRGRRHTVRCEECISCVQTLGSEPSEADLGYDVWIIEKLFVEMYILFKLVTQKIIRVLEVWLALWAVVFLPTSIVALIKVCMYIADYVYVYVYVYVAFRFSSLWPTSLISVDIVSFLCWRAMRCWCVFDYTNHQLCMIWFIYHRLYSRVYWWADV